MISIVSCWDIGYLGKVKFLATRDRKVSCSDFFNICEKTIETILRYVYFDIRFSSESLSLCLIIDFTTVDRCDLSDKY